MTILLFVSCSQKPEKTKAKISVGAIAGDSTLFPGGMYLLIHKVDKENKENELTRSIRLKNTVMEVELDNGLWDFAVIGWTGGSAGSVPQNFTGQMRCALKENVTLSGGAFDLNLVATLAGCEAEPFTNRQSGIYNTTIGFFPIKFHACSGLVRYDRVEDGNTDTTLSILPANFTCADKQGVGKSFQVAWYEFPLSNRDPSVLVNPEWSKCYAAAGSTNYSDTAANGLSSALRMPLIGLPMKVKVFSDTNCQTLSKEHLFMKGLSNYSRDEQRSLAAGSSQHPERVNFFIDDGLNSPSNPSNNAPVLTAIANQVVHEGVAIATVNADDGGDDLDIDGDALSYTCVFDQVIDGTVATGTPCASLGMVFNTATGVLDWTPGTNDSGNYEVKIVASDGTLSDDVIFQITVNDVGGIQISINSTLANGYVNNGQTVTLTITTGTPGETITATVEGVAASVTDNADGTYNISYTISGGEIEGVIDFDITYNGNNYTTTTDTSQVILDKTAPASPTVIRSGSIIPAGVSANPVYQATGVEVGATVEIYANDASCISSLVASEVATGTTEDLTVAGLTNKTEYNFYARQVDMAGNTSACVASPDPYLYHNQPFVSDWQTTTAAESIRLPLRTGPYTYNMIVDWGDGGYSYVVSATDPARDHVYATPGVYTITIYGTMETIYFNNGIGDGISFNKILSISDLGDMGWTNFNSAFYGCANLTTVFGGVTNNVTDMSYMFQAATNAQPDGSTWATSNVTMMMYMFDGAAMANPNTSGWDTANVTAMSGMFYNASSANPDVSAWDTSSVVDMSSMFNGATLANPDVSGWDTSNVTSFNFMFANAASANPDVSGWITNNVTDMAGMFSGAASFNQPIGSWSVANVTTMYSMFANASSFNQNISGWTTGAVTDMSQMFYGASAFNQDISAWNLSSLTTIDFMFYAATSFDQDLSIWNINTAVISATSYDTSAIAWNVANKPNVY